jgi:hypothetical protein
MTGVEVGVARAARRCLMEQLILVESAGPGRFTAQAVAFPECRAKGPTEAEAVELVRLSLAARFASARLVRIEVPVNGTGNP